MSTLGSQEGIPIKAMLTAHGPAEDGEEEESLPGYSSGRLVIPQSMRRIAGQLRIEPTQSTGTSPE